MSSFKYTRVAAVAEQPRTERTMDLKSASQSTDALTEKGLVCHPHAHQNHHHHACEQCDSTTSESDHRHCHNGRLRRILAPLLVALLLLGGLLALGCMTGHGSGSEGWGWGWGVDSLVSRAVEDTTNGNQSTFVHNKLYLIVIFVGLLLVVILAVMLSAWCCKGAFQNPLCCPCYLCACCGGLACLECIGCGLCAEGVDQAF